MRPASSERRVPELLGTSDLPVAELSAAVLDGELYRLGVGFRPVDLPGDASARAGSVRDAIGPARIAAGTTAAWIWGAVDRAETPYTAFVPSTARLGHPTGVRDALVRVRVVRIRSGDVADVGGTPVTTPARTALDLLCDHATPDPDVIERLLRIAGCEPAAFAATLWARPSRLTGRRRAVERLQVLVTR